MSAEEAKRRHILPPNDHGFLPVEDSKSASNTSSLNRINVNATKTATTPPVAVVHGKQMSVQHDEDENSL